MNRSIGVIAVGILVITILVLPAAAQEQKTQEHYAATIAVVGGMAGGSTGSIDMWIDKFSTNEEAVSLATLLAEKGQDALRLAMEKLDAGRMSIDNEGIIPIAFARSLTSNNGRVIRLFVARNIMFLEHFHLSRSRDYPFSIIEMQVNEKGQGQGAAIAAAKIRFDDKARQFIVESLGQGTNLKLMNVRRF